MKTIVSTANRSLLFIVGGLLAFVLSTCKQKPETLFRLLPADETGIEFSNTIFESDTFNIFDYDYIYNGGGVAVADFNNDGWQDIFFTGNMVPNKLYLNKGDLKFEDVSSQANVNLPGKWNSGVTVVDINNDGWQDLYVCATKSDDSLRRANMLFLNKGLNANNIPVFEEVAAQYGIADTGYSLMASFLDYDRDGDVDLYVLTNKQLGGHPSNYRPKVTDGSSPTNDRLYRNNGNGTFTNVTKEAGILYEGYGLGLAVADFNVDGWPDIYVSNDFVTTDILYLNNRNGTFSNNTKDWVAHQSQSSMGNDAADFNNDALPDIITTDMLPETNDRKKTSIGNKHYVTYINNEEYGYEYQYMRNMLHLNNGLQSGIGFSEIGQLSGIYQTEWSWSVLFSDFDNDGLKDLVVTNGFPKDITDKDFVSYRLDVGSVISNAMLLDSVPIVRIPNYAFKNNGDLTFTDVSKTWGFTQPSFSNGAAFTDLDNDGDLDYIVNNINDMAFVYENTVISKEKPPSVHFLRIKLAGSATNKNAVGAKVKLYYDSGKVQFLEQQTARGYVSSVESILHFGLGNKTSVDSVIVVWQDGGIQKVTNPGVDQVLTVTYQPASIPLPKATAPVDKRLFTKVPGTKLEYKHPEEDRIDYNIQRTLPHKYSQSGPGISVGDITGDGLDDLVIGGSYGYTFTTYIQKSDGSFVKLENQSTQQEKHEEDEGLLLFDADGDADLDLYIVSGGLESDPLSTDYQDKLYKNNGKGKFVLDTKALPPNVSSGSCVRATDFDGDNDLDLFVGGRIVPASYPYPAVSSLLKNDNGVFTDVTNTLGPELSAIGMVTDALFSDFNNDGKTDLVVVGEYLPVSFFENKNGAFRKIDSTGVESYTGWWNSIAGGDFDSDGDIDYIAGNLGLNNNYQVNTEFPLSVYAKDFDGNGSVDAVLACYIKESLANNQEKKLYPVHFWDELNSQSPKFRRKFNRYRQYAKVTIDKLFTPEELKDALVLQANHFETSYIENTSGGKFVLHKLPNTVQIAPVNGIVVDDLNEDGNLDALLVGNDFGNEVFAGRYDAFTGLVLSGDGKGNFRPLQSVESGFYVPRDAKALVKVSGVKNNLYIASRNRDSLAVFKTTLPGNYNEFEPETFDSWAELIYDNGQKQKVEFYYGSGYLSQSTRKIKYQKTVREIVVYDSKGQSRKIQKAFAAAH